MSNNNNTQQTTFWKFLRNHRIEIPIIQRDYAQGRIGKEKLREKFLKDLKFALDNNTKIKLDFVYGSKDDNRLQPLDGQQRLTTLWLLHWYIAHQAGKLVEAKGLLKNFTYETRVTSREFCEKLCDSNVDPVKKIVEEIQNQTWFYSAWKQDPTIQSMLHMLGGTKILDEKHIDIPDGIEEIFTDCDFNKYWTNLTSDDNCPITFYYLDLNDSSLSDDLYIKMNARGKPLTSFENFKADLVGYIKEKKWEDRKSPTGTIAHKLDTLWTDIFWKYKSPEYKIDEIYFTFLKRYYINCLITVKKEDNYLFSAEKLEQSESFKNLWELKLEYTNFDAFNPKASDDDLFGYGIYKTLECILDNFYTAFKSEKKENINNLFCPFDDNKFDFQFIPEYTKSENTNKVDYKPTSITQLQRVVFHAVCCFLKRGTYQDQEALFHQWMRVVWNIVENAGINGILPMIRAIRLIDELGKHSHDIYNWLANPENKIISDVAFEQVEEEREKARLIINNRLWENKIIEAEKFAFFKGAIRFLLKDERGNWNSENFDLKLSHCKKYFDAEGVQEPYKANAQLLKAIISRCPEADFVRLTWWEKYIYDNKAETWRNNYLLKKDWAYAVHELLLGQIDIKSPNTTLLYRNLFKSDLLNYVAEKMPGSRMRSIYGHKAIYQPRYPGIILDDNDYHRNNILTELLFNREIECPQKIDEIPFFFGWDIKFLYNDKWFQWNTDNNIYVIDEKNNRIRNTKNQDICMPIDKDADYDSIMNILNELSK